MFQYIIQKRVLIFSACRELFIGRITYMVVVIFEYFFESIYNEKPSIFIIVSNVARSNPAIENCVLSTLN